MATNKEQDWGEVREQGKWCYIRRYGVIGWGIQTFIIFYILLNIFEHGFNLAAIFSGKWITEISIYLLVFMVCGGVWGYFMWGSNERKYIAENRVHESQQIKKNNKGNGKK